MDQKLENFCLQKLQNIESKNQQIIQHQDLNDEARLQEEKKKLRVRKLMEQLKLLMVMKMLKEDASPIQIMEHLYIGSIAAAYSKESLEKSQIKYILSVCDSPEQLPQFNYLKINVSDTVDQKITDYFKAASKFIDEGIKSKQNVLVHCFAGKSRSTSFIIAYLMEYAGLNYESALELVKSKRPIAQPNQGFIRQLKDYYIELQNN